MLSPRDALLALAAPVLALAVSCEISSGTPGTCISTSSCSTSGGTSHPGFCPGSSDIQCCTYGGCTANGQSGLCIPTSTCDGTSTPGFCPGDSSIQCCTYGSCSSGSSSGTCRPTSACSGTSVAGLCPGPANVQCCLASSGSSPGGDGSKCEDGFPVLNQASLDLIKEFEGVYLDIYPDPDGNPTVGIGHLCDDASCSEVGYPIPLSTANAWNLLLDDLVEFRTCVSNAIATAVKINANQFGALVSWAFNMGCGNMRSSTLIRRLNNGENPNTVAAEELPRWVNGASGVLPGLVRRRNAEVALFRTSNSVVANPNPC